MNSKKLSPSSDKGQLPPLVTTGKRTRKASSDASDTSASFMGSAEKKTLTGHPPITDRTVAGHDIESPDTCPVQTLASVLDDNSQYRDIPLVQRIQEWETAEMIECMPKQPEERRDISLRRTGSKDCIQVSCDLNAPVTHLCMELVGKGVPLSSCKILYKGSDIIVGASLAEQLGHIIDASPGATSIWIAKHSANSYINDFLNSTFTDEQGGKKKMMPTGLCSTTDIENQLKELYEGTSKQQDSPPQCIKSYLMLERCIMDCRLRLNSLSTSDLPFGADPDFLRIKKCIDNYLDCVLRITGVCKWLFIFKQNQIITQELDKLPEKSLPELPTDRAGTKAIIKTPEQEVEVDFSILEQLGSNYFTWEHEFTSLQNKSSPATFILKEFVREGPVLEALLQFLTKYNLEKVEELNAEEVIELYGIANCLQIDYLQTYCLRMLLKAIRYNLFTTDQLKTLHDYKDSHSALERACQNSIDLAKLDAKLVLPPPQQLFPEQESSTSSTNIFGRNCTIQ